MMNIIFENGSSKFVVTPNTPVRQVWISAQATSLQTGVVGAAAGLRAAEDRRGADSADGASAARASGRCIDHTAKVPVDNGPGVASRSHFHCVARHPLDCVNWPEPSQACPSIPKQIHRLRCRLAERCASSKSVCTQILLHRRRLEASVPHLACIVLPHLRTLRRDREQTGRTVTPLPRRRHSRSPSSPRMKRRTLRARWPACSSPMRSSCWTPPRRIAPLRSRAPSTRRCTTRRGRGSPDRRTPRLRSVPAHGSSRSTRMRS